MHYSAIKQFELYARENPDVISLAQGLPITPSPNEIRNFVITQIKKDATDRYSEPQGMIVVRQAVSRHLKKQVMLYAPEEILLTVGACEALASTLLAVAAPGDEVLVPSPTYSSFFNAITLARCIPKAIPLQESSGWKLSLTDMEQRISTKTKAIIICNPNNPTGSLYTKQELLSICDVAKKRNIIVILDEVYGNMGYDEAPLYSPASVEAYKDNIVRIVSFSKDYSLTGWRIAFLHTKLSLLERILRVHDTLVHCAPVISQYAALGALQLPSSYLLNKKALYRTQRDLMGRYLAKLSAYLSFSTPQGGYFFFPKMHNFQESQQLAHAILSEANVALVPGSEFGPGGEQHLRLCFGRTTEQITEAMERLVAYFHSL